MKNVLGGAIAVVALLSAHAAVADEVVFAQSGNTNSLSLYYPPLPGAGNYRFDFTSSIPVLVAINAGYEYHYDTFVAPPPKPHSEFIEGNSYAVEDYYEVIGGNVSWSFLVPETQYTFFPAPAGYFDIQEGTLLYEEVKFDDPYFGFYAEDLDYAAFDYTLTVTRISAVPEPGTWALVICGFGLAGSALRSSRRRMRPASVC